MSGIEIPCAGSGQDAEFKTAHRIPAERFQVMTDVVLDSLTGITGCRNANLAEFPLDWNAAHDFINEMNGVRAFGRSDWRLPSRKELFMLVSHEVFNPALPKDHPFLDGVKATNKKATGRHTDWRRPNIRELESLVDINSHSPAMPPNHPFARITDGYWSSTTSVYEPRYAWVLYTLDGAVGVGYKAKPDFYALRVRPR